jgi:hypothetical protein
MKIQQETQYFSREELANRWRFCRSTIEKIHSTGSLPYKKIGRQYFYSLEVIKAYEASHTVYPTKVIVRAPRKTKISLSEISKVPIERIISLSTEEFLELSKKANDNLAEAKSQKDWIDGIIAIRNLTNDEDNNNDNDRNNNILGGIYEQTTNY